jgi:predicted trehalose synthase
MRSAMKAHPRGPQQPINRLPEERAQRIQALCQRHPTLSSYQVRKSLGSDAPSARTIQRLRHRLALARLTKRAPPAFTAPSVRRRREALHPEHGRS